MTPAQIAKMASDLAHVAAEFARAAVSVCGLMLVEGLRNYDPEILDVRHLPDLEKLAADAKKISEALAGLKPPAAPSDVERG